MKRRSITKTMRVALFTRESGLCHMCGGLVTPGQVWDVSHERPLAMGGADDESNWKVAHRKCHRDHTSQTDIPQIAKAKRREAKHIGATRPKQTIRSQGFDHKPRSEKLPLPPMRSLYEDATK